MSRTSVNQARRYVFRVYWLIFMTLVLGALSVWFATVVRTSWFPFAYSLATVTVPGLIRAVWADPLLLPAFVVGSLLLWSFPRERVWAWLASGNKNYVADNVMRGRRLGDSEAAHYRSYRDLVRRRNQRRRQQREGD